MKTADNRRLAKPARLRVSLHDEPSGSLLFRFNQRSLVAGLVMGAFFAVFAAIAWHQLSEVIHAIKGNGVDRTTDLIFILFQVFWLMGWSVGVLVLAVLTILFLLPGGETTRINRERIIHQSRFAFLRIISEYDLNRIRTPRYENSSICFDYGKGRTRLSCNLPRSEAERVIARISEACGKTPAIIEPPEQVIPEPLPEPTAVDRVSPDDTEWSRPSAVFLIAANLVPLLGVLFMGWSLGDLMLLFWSENLIIGLFNIMKLVIVGRFMAIVAIPFFVGHYGGFMSVHFLFVYSLFVQGGKGGNFSDSLTTVMNSFEPLWPALLALALSHGASFYLNFLENREYVGRKLSDQMHEPYKRVIILHVTIIVGGGLTLVLGSPLPALMVLIALKIAVDLHAHRNERRHAAQARLGKGGKA